MILTDIFQPFKKSFIKPGRLVRCDTSEGVIVARVNENYSGGAIIDITDEGSGIVYHILIDAVIEWMEQQDYPEYFLWFIKLNILYQVIFYLQK